MKSVDMDVTPRKAVSDMPLRKALTYDDGFGADIIRCPVCKFDYSHISQIEENKSDHYKAWAGRGDCIVIPFEGECGHRWNICIGYHKGQNYAFVDIVQRAAKL